MADDRDDERNLPVPYNHHQRAQRQSSVPAGYRGVAVPSLPTSSGAWLGSRTRIARKDAEYVRQHEALIRSDGSRTDALRELIDKRIELGKALTRWADRDHIFQTEFMRGRADREFSLRLQSLTHETELEWQRAKLAEAQRHHLSFYPDPPSASAPALPAPPPTQPSGPSEAEIREEAERRVAALHPDVSPDQQRALVDRHFAFGLEEHARRKAARDRGYGQ